MHTEARVGVVVQGGQRALNSAHGAVDGSGVRKLSRIPQQQPTMSQIGTISQLLAGGVSGALSKSFTAPLGRLTIPFQLLFLWILQGEGNNWKGLADGHVFTRPGFSVYLDI